ncbi:MAG: trimethylamine methyltransferase family protein, partial [Anaerolineales bacterium]
KPVEWATSLELLPDKAVHDIHEASLQIMEHTGLIMPLNREKQEEACDLGLHVERETDRIRFPPEIIEAAIEKAPSSYTLFARKPENDILLDGRYGYLGLDGSGTLILDLETGAVHNSTKADLQTIAQIADALPQISFLWPAISAQDYPARVQPLHELEALLNHSSKHVQAMTAVDALNARGTVEIAAEVVGGREKLRARPIISNFQCSVSPLSYNKDSLEAAYIFGKAGIPVGFLCMSIGCASAPATVAGSAALANAEVLAGITLFQLFYPGVPTFYGSSATMMELRSGGITSGGPEDFLLQAAACQLARFYGVPASIGTFATCAKTSNWHAGVENAISGAVSQFTGADMMCGAGLLHGARIFSFEQLLMDCEIYDMLRSAAQGFVVNEGTLALDIIQQTGPKNHFLTSDHTLEYMGQIWQPTIIDRRSSWDDWVAKGRPSPHDQAREMVRQFFAPQQQTTQFEYHNRRQATSAAKQFLSNYEPEPLACSERIGEIIATYEIM